MLAMARSDDDRILREMLAPDLEEALEALGYWLARRTQLPFYRRAARRETERMIRYWQARAIADAPRAPIALLVCGRDVVRVARLAASYHAGRALGRITLLTVAALAAVAALGILR
jgi:hypothetical protein